eukprot:13548104-Alexandrium_andersonii.AAC.1
MPNSSEAHAGPLAAPRPRASGRGAAEARAKTVPRQLRLGHPELVTDGASRSCERNTPLALST